MARLDWKLLRLTPTGSLSTERFDGEVGIATQSAEQKACDGFSSDLPQENAE